MHRYTAFTNEMKFSFDTENYRKVSRAAGGYYIHSMTAVASSAALRATLASEHPGGKGIAWLLGHCWSEEVRGHNCILAIRIRLVYCASARNKICFQYLAEDVCLAFFGPLRSFIEGVASARKGCPRRIREK